MQKLSLSWRTADPFLFIGLAIILCTLEVSAYSLHGGFSFLACRVWAIMGSVYLLSTLLFCLSALINDLRQKKVLFAVVIMLLGAITFYGIGTHLKINSEACLQIAAAFKNLEMPDWGYTQNAFIGYPCRQYLIAALPSIFLGRSVLALALGFRLVFFLGCLVYFVGVRDWFRRKCVSDWVSLLALIFIFTCPTVFILIFYSDQSLLPLALSLNLMGWFLRALHTKNRVAILNVIWIGSLLGASYTPSLAVCGLLIVSLMLVARQSIHQGCRRDATVWIASAFIISIFCLCTFFTRTDLGHDRTTIDTAVMLSRAGKGLWSFILIYLTPLSTCMLISYLSAVFLSKLGKYHFLFVIWIFGVVLSIVLLHGYAEYAPHIALFKAVVILPFLGVALMSAMVTHIHPLVPARWIPVGYGLACLLNLLLSVPHYQTAFNNHQKTLYDFPIADMTALSKQHSLSQAPVEIIILDQFGNLPDYIQYFFPAWTIHLNPNSKQWACSSKEHPIFVFSAQDAVTAPYKGCGKLLKLKQYNRLGHIGSLYQYLPVN